MFAHIVSIYDMQDAILKANGMMGYEPWLGATREMVWKRDSALDPVFMKEIEERVKTGRRDGCLYSIRVERLEYLNTIPPDLARELFRNCRYVGEPITGEKLKALSLREDVDAFIHASFEEVHPSYEQGSGR